MGQTKRIRKKYSPPSHPWQASRIIEEKGITHDYGLVNKKEIWRYSAKLKSARQQVKRIIANINSEQAIKEKKQLIDKLIKYKLISKDSKMEDILELTLKDFLERRLQTIVFKLGLARTPKQARQFILHGHILVNEKKVTSPSYLVKKDEESKISLNPLSTLSKEDHPERVIKDKDKGKEKIIKEVEEKIEPIVKEITEEIENV